MLEEDLGVCVKRRRKQRRLHSSSKRRRLEEQLLKDSPSRPHKKRKKKCAALSEASTAATSAIDEEDEEVPAPLPPAVKPSSEEAGSLPVWSCAAEILASIQQNQVTLLIGETGSGKTTQVPQMLFHSDLLARHGAIAITQPRRVAAISLASRVNRELTAGSVALGEGPVGYAVRFDSKTAGAATRIKFLTDGVLLREQLTDRKLRKYSIVIIDEAHERTVRTDVLLGILQGILKKRPKLRLVIMSATLLADTFVNFFQNFSTKVINVPGRKFAVDIAYASNSVSNRVAAVAQAAVAAHLQLRKEPGDLLCFLPGQEEISRAKKLIETQLAQVEEAQQKFFAVHSLAQQIRAFCIGDGSKWNRLVLLLTEKIKDKALQNEVAAHFGSAVSETQQLVRQIVREAPNATIDTLESLSLTFKSPCIGGDIHFGHVNYAPADTTAAAVVVRQETFLTAKVLSLYAALSLDEQRSIFEPAEAGVRKIVLATNVAETSVTIPGVRVVIDGGELKEKTFNPLNGVERLSLRRVSRASACQRAGRAGREGPGRVFRCYTVQDYMMAETAPEPEITRCDLAGVVLELKLRGCGRPEKEFPFVTRPPESAFRSAVQTLKNLGAIDKTSELVTERGKSLALLPLPPEWGSFVLYAIEFGCVAEALVLAALLTAGDGLPGGSAVRSSTTFGDHWALVLSYNAWAGAQGKTKRNAVASALGLSRKALQGARAAGEQLKNILTRPPFNLPTISSCLTAEDGRATLGRCLVKSFPHRLARLQISSGGAGRRSKVEAQYLVESSRQSASIHPSSSLFGLRDKPQWVLFSELFQSNKLYLRHVSVVQEDWVRESHPAMLISRKKAEKAAAPKFRWRV